MRNLIIQKFGGTSVGDINRIRHIVKYINYEISQKNKLIIILSAMKGDTASLIDKYEKISDLNAKYDAYIEYAPLVASGEIISASMLSLELRRNNINAISMQGWQVPIITNDNYIDADILDINVKRLHDLLDKNIIPVITGFQGVNSENRITTLGRGGSDTSAVAISYYMNAKRCDIYTDAMGVYSADPKIVKDAKKLDCINTEHMMEMASGGAKILHEKASKIASQNKINNIRILSSFDTDVSNIEKEGTIISDDGKYHLSNQDIRKEGDLIFSNKILSINGFKEIYKISSNNIKDIIEFINEEQRKKILNKPTNHKTDYKNREDIKHFNIIRHINDNSFLIDIEKFKNFENSINKFCKNKNIDYKIDNDIAIISMTFFNPVNIKMLNSSNKLNEMIGHLQNNNIKLFDYYSLNYSICLIISDVDIDNSIRILHNLLISNKQI